MTSAQRCENCGHEVAVYDDLTGALNRATGVARLRARLASADAGDELAVIFIDLNTFKQINDRFGHGVGDRVLRVMAERFAAHIRGYDLLARVGGDEFIALVETEGDQDVAQRVAERLSAAAQQPVAVEQHLVQLSANIGISHFPADGRDAEELVGNADFAMYEAKRAGETAPRRFSPELRAERDRQEELRSRALAALDRRELVLHYQPQIDLESGAVIGLEALVRWADPEHGLRMPEEFIATMEAAGLLSRLTPYVLDLACRDNAALIAAGELDVPVAVNVAAACFAGRHFLAQVQEALARHRLAADRLEIELPETGALALVAPAQALHELGVGLVLDDFGTGLSSIALLSEHHVSRLKIDRDFVAALPGTDRDVALMAGLLAVGRGLGMRMVAEGVETDAQRDLLQQHGCPAAQGWLYAPALPLDELRTWLSARRTASVPAPRRAVGVPSNA